jgi:sugar lactone lactonase YvrE
VSEAASRGVKALTSQVVIDDIIYPEGIRWAQGRVWFSDMFARRVYAYDPATGITDVAAQTEDLPSGLGFLPDGRLLIVGMRERQLLRRDPDGLTVAADLSPLSELLNDMVVDAHGRAYVDGHFERDTEGGGILLAEPDGRCRVVAGDMKAPNGLAITPDGSTLIANDLLANALFAFDIQANGDLTNRRVHLDLGDRSPDGLCLDLDGGVWIGLPFQNRMQRIGPDGQVTHEIDCGDKWGIAPVLGGADRKTLFFCTARVAIDDMIGLLKDPTHAKSRCRGWIEAVDGIEVAGAGRP